MKVPDDNEEWWLTSEEDGDGSDDGSSRMSNGGQLNVKWRSIEWQTKGLDTISLVMKIDQTLFFIIV